MASALKNPLQQQQKKRKESNTGKSKEEERHLKKKAWKGETLRNFDGYEPLVLSTILAFNMVVDAKETKDIQVAAKIAKQEIEQQLQIYFDKVYDGQKTWFQVKHELLVEGEDPEFLSVLKKKENDEYVKTSNYAVGDDVAFANVTDKDYSSERFGKITKITHADDGNDIEQYCDILFDDGGSVTKFKCRQKYLTRKRSKTNFSLLIHLFHFEFIQTRVTTKFIFELLNTKQINASIEDYTIYPIIDPQPESTSRAKQVCSNHLTKKILKKGTTNSYTRFQPKKSWCAGNVYEGAWLYNINMHKVEIVNGNPNIPKKSKLRNFKWEIKEKNINMIPMGFKTQGFNVFHQYLKYQDEGDTELDEKFGIQFHIQEKRDIQIQIPRYMGSFQNNNEFCTLRAEKLNHPNLTWSEIVHPGRIKSHRDKAKIINGYDKEDDDWKIPNDIKHLHKTKEMYYHDVGEGKNPEDDPLLKQISHAIRLPQHSFAKALNENGSIYRGNEWLEECLLSMNLGEVSIFRYETLKNASAIASSRNKTDNIKEQYVMIKLNHVEYDLESCEINRGKCHSCCCVTTVGDEYNEYETRDTYIKIKGFCCKDASKCVGCNSIYCICKNCLYPAIFCFVALVAGMLGSGGD